MSFHSKLHTKGYKVAVQSSKIREKFRGYIYVRCLLKA